LGKNRFFGKKSIFWEKIDFLGKKIGLLGKKIGFFPNNPIISQKIGFKSQFFYRVIPNVFPLDYATHVKILFNWFDLNVKETLLQFALDSIKMRSKRVDDLSTSMRKRSEDDSTGKIVFEGLKAIDLHI
jgi:hypothetical protein